MATLDDLRAKYGFDGGNHDPKPDCKFCSGTGERKVKRTGKDTFCICLFVDHHVSDMVGSTLGDVAKKELAKLDKLYKRA